MKFIVHLALLLCALANGSAQAAQTFNYSYTFDTGEVISGSFSGIANGNLISGLSNITANFNGTPFSGSGNLFSAAYTGSGFGGSAVVSIDGLQSNFIFGPDSNFAEYFYVIPWAGGIGAQAYIPAVGYIDYVNTHYIPSNWHVTAAIPEPETYAMLLAGLGLLGFTARRRKQAA